MSNFQELLMTLQYARGGSKLAELAEIYGARQGAEPPLWEQRISAILAKWVPRLGQIGLELSNLEVSKAFQDAMRPPIYDTLGYPDVGPLVDGKDIETEEHRNRFDLHQASHSSKIHTGALRGLSSMTTIGLFHATTDLHLGKATETELYKMLAHDAYRDLDPELKVLADKGFAAVANLNANLNKILSPPFKVMLPSACLHSACLLFKLRCLLFNGLA